MTFDFVSKIDYEHPALPVNLHPSCRKQQHLKWRVTTKSDSSRIFSNFKSEWRIYVDNNNTATRTKHDTCLVTYEVEMTFASAMFNAVTRQFFDFLVDDIDQ